jgi:hypothetical protein
VRSATDYFALFKNEYKRGIFYRAYTLGNGNNRCVGKILGARISEEDKKTILSGRAFSRFLERKVK